VGYRPIYKCSNGKGSYDCFSVCSGLHSFLYYPHSLTLIMFCMLEDKRICKWNVLDVILLFLTISLQVSER